MIGKDFTLAATLCVILLVFGSCSRNKKTTQTPSPINPMVEKLDETPDSALLVVLDDVVSNTMNVTTVKEKQQLSFNLSDAYQEKNIKGSLNPGDTLSIFPDNKTKSIKMSINVSELSGRWFYDMQQHRGLVFESHGAMSSINALTISYRQWKLLNGKLYIYYVDMQQVANERHQYLVDEAQITSLSKDHLEFVFRGNKIRCQRVNQVIKFSRK